MRWAFEVLTYRRLRKRGTKRVYMSGVVVVTTRKDDEGEARRTMLENLHRVDRFVKRVRLVAKKEGRRG